MGFGISQRKFLWVRRGCQASQRKGLTSGEVGELPGKFGELPGNLWIAVKFHSERTSGEVAEKLPGKRGELPGKSGDFPEAQGSLTPSQRLAKFVSKFLSVGLRKRKISSGILCFRNYGLLLWPVHAQRVRGESKCKGKSGETDLPFHYESESEETSPDFNSQREPKGCLN